MGFSGIKSIVRIAVKNSDKILLMKKNCKSKTYWRIPYKKFNSQVNGNLKDTADRVLKYFLGIKLDDSQSLYYLGSSIQKRSKDIFLVYDLILEYNKKLKLGKNSKWVELKSIEDLEVDELTKNFIELNWNRLKLN